MSYAIALGQAMVLYYAISFLVIALLSKVFGFNSTFDIAMDLAMTVFMFWLPLFGLFLLTFAASFFMEKRRLRVEELTHMQDGVADTNATIEAVRFPPESNPENADASAPIGVESLLGTDLAARSGAVQELVNENAAVISGAEEMLEELMHLQEPHPESRAPIQAVTAA